MKTKHLLSAIPWYWELKKIPLTALNVLEFGNGIANFWVYSHVHFVLESYKQHENGVCRVADGETLSPGVHSIMTPSREDGALFNWAFIPETMLWKWAEIRYIPWFLQHPHRHSVFKAYIRLLIIPCFGEVISSINIGANFNEYTCFCISTLK